MIKMKLQTLNLAFAQEEVALRSFLMIISECCNNESFEDHVVLSKGVPSKEAVKESEEHRGQH